MVAWQSGGGGGGVTSCALVTHSLDHVHGGGASCAMLTYTLDHVHGAESGVTRSGDAQARQGTIWCNSSCIRLRTVDTDVLDFSR